MGLIGSYAQILWKWVCGFVGAWILTKVGFLFLVYESMTINWILLIQPTGFNTADQKKKYFEGIKGKSEIRTYYILWDIIMY